MGEEQVREMVRIKKREVRRTDIFLVSGDGDEVIGRHYWMIYIVRSYLKVRGINHVIFRVLENYLD